MSVSHKVIFDATNPQAASAGRERSEPAIGDDNTFANRALIEAKREGLLLAVRARWVALAIIAVLVVFLNQTTAVLVVHAQLLLFALIGWAQLKVGRVGRSAPEFFLLLSDLVLLTIAATVPNPLVDADWPTAVQYRLGVFIFFFVILASGTLAYSWRTIIAIGHWVAGLWLLSMVFVYLLPNAKPEWSDAISKAVGGDERLVYFIDPNNIEVGTRVQEAVTFVIVAYILALTVKRSNDLLRSHASVERERTNLARYFSPNVVEELAQNDEPLKQVRNQDVAVLFVDIVGFTKWSSGRTPEDVIALLRDFHQAMGEEVFRHNGTLDKYMGDGLMATFGTPLPGDNDAVNALNCCHAMMARIDALSKERVARGEDPLSAGLGLHYGPVVLGNIGSNRLEFTVIGSTVNVASRLESATRKLGSTLVVSNGLVEQARSEPRFEEALLADFVQRDPVELRGMPDPIAIWTAR